LLLLFKFVGTENLQTTLSFRSSETLIVTLEECEDILDNISLQVDLFLVIEVVCLKLDLGFTSQGVCIRMDMRREREQIVPSTCQQGRLEKMKRVRFSDETRILE
jgi:hypothetical protein